MNNFDFRVYDPELKEMSFDVTLYANGWTECVFNSGHEKKYKPNTIGIMQWSGLYDRKGNKLYEGDILKQKNDFYLIVFEEGSFQAFNVWNRHTFLNESHMFFEVVGNIHENNNDYEGWFQ